MADSKPMRRCKQILRNLMKLLQTYFIFNNKQFKLESKRVLSQIDSNFEIKTNEKTLVSTIRKSQRSSYY